METARVDIRKLQLLNDRIGQCLDALAQVRLSVHGLAHSQANQGIGSLGMAGQTAPGAFPGAQDPRFAQGAQIPFGQQLGQQQIPPFVPPFAGFYGGLSHTPFGQPFGAQQGAYWPQQQGQFGNQQPNPFVQQGWGGQIPGFGIGGLSHTGNDLESLYARPLWADPMLQARVRETFPYLGYTLPPTISLF
jgi:hypothetical protein